MEYVVFLATVVFIVVAIFIKGSIDAKRKRKNFTVTLKEAFGKFPEKEYKQEQYDSISHFYNKYRTQDTIDDITWNDLEMDRLFQMMNHTYSSAGEEYLYYTLRQPKSDAGLWKDMEELVQYFQTHEEDRITLQLTFADIGKTGKFSLWDYLDYLDNLGNRSNAGQIFINCLYPVCLGLVFISPALGAVLLIALIGFNIASYFREKGEIEPYITSFSYIIRILRGAESINSLKIPVLKEQQEKLGACRKQFRRFTRNASLVVAGSNMSGNPLEILLDYIKMMFHLDIIKFNSMLSELRNKTETIEEMIRIMGYLETNIAIGMFRVSLMEYCIPVFEENKGISAECIYHPYIREPVTNDITVQNGALLTGSNASGKSTFLKTIALNAVMAQTINTATAKSFHTSFYRIYSSMSLRDDLESGESYYMVEIKSLKRILDAALEKDKRPVLCFVDEVLRGTNTVERIAASTQILTSLAKPGILCFAATHDIELTKLLKKQYDNYHFTEEIREGDVLFSYKLLTGSATTRNAIKLLSVIGYQEEIIEAATEMAGAFLESGQWGR